MTTTTETFTSNDETFTKGTYNGINVLIRDKDGYINGSKLGNESRPARKFINSERFNEICRFWLKNRSGQNRPDPETPAKYLLSNVSNEFKGTYIHPQLVHFVAEWVDIEYAFIVSDIMDSINDKVHEVLNEKQLPDTVENAKPVFVDVAKQIAPSIQTQTLENQCWGYRDKVYELDQWEKDDLRRCLDDYKEIKEKLIEQEQELSKWGKFIDRYFPEFNK
ncbi:KilA-N domain-containing protein [uncultured Brachyspira sp.]|uniref:KilA-N domain-containing protein n=1 Tax=uncultured Brachyspira sp. TaxID=221953 RepID=UPI002635C8E1|nr:KilA-N domain-containing protein [uncultured Brachyspira sp.]